MAGSVSSAFLFSFLLWKFFVETFHIEKTVTECNSFFGREQGTVFCSSLRRFCKFLFRINVQKFQLFLTCFWDCFKELTPAVARQQTRTTSSILPYALYPSHWSIPVKTMEKFYRIIPAPSGSVIIQDDRWFSISPRSGRSTYRILKWQFFPLHEAPDRVPRLHGGSLLPAVPDALLHRLERDYPMNSNVPVRCSFSWDRHPFFHPVLLTDGKREGAESFSGT